MKGIRLTKEQYEAHQRKHGFTIHQDPVVEPRKRGGIAISPSGEPYWSEGEPKMNATERQFAYILEAQKRKGEIARWEYEGITLRWGGLRYMPDFVVFEFIGKDLPLIYRAKVRMKFIETKGPYIREDAMVKFKAAKAHWQEFEFEMWQKANGSWRRLY